MFNLVCVDRDGTINEDENHYLGSSPSWKSQVKIIDTVIEGIKKLNTLPNSVIFVITNQAGVALEGDKFSNLTEEKMHEVNEYILDILKKNRANVNGCFACPFVDNKYVEKAKSRGWKVNEKYIKEGHEDLKPNIGMIKKAAESFGLKISECNVYVIGDRKSDVEFGLNANGKGILIASAKTKELGDVDNLKEIMKRNKDKVFIAKDFLDAANIIIEDVKKQEIKSKVN